MNCCYICQAEAVARCYTCGELICDQHGGENCLYCDTAVMAGDPPGRNVTRTPRRRVEARHGWWRPQEAEGFAPPACYACKGLARAVCQSCRCYYCREHAGAGRRCVDCSRSARLGLIVFVVAIGLLVSLVLFGRLVP